MNEIKAFVGHSFSEEDEELVGKFTKYFDSLARSHPQFSWQSAERAEPRILTEKVLRIIADKNTFIGICTRKEQVASQTAVAPLLFQSDFVKVSKSKLVWKTSDWIIQEIGMAVGRNLNVILLVEEGVRDPGGLQGDIEYIPFSRAHPERAFNKILEMLSTLSPKTASPLGVVSDAKTDEEGEAPKPSTNDYLAMPDATWTRRRYEMAAFNAVGMEAEDRLKLISDAYKATGEASAGDNLITWDALVEYLRIRVGRGGKLDRLKEIAEKNPSSAETLSYLAKAYTIFEQHKQSAETFMRAFEVAADLKKKAEYAQGATRQFALSDQPAEVSKTLTAFRALVSQTPSLETRLLYALADLAERNKEGDVELALLERLVELNPDDHRLRFNLAFKHGDQSAELSVYHYLMIPYAERTAIAWNNLGADFDQFKLAVKSVQAYQQASDMGETLAMSNLGYKFMNAGFLKEAQACCDKAIATGNPHKNIGQFLTALQNVPEDEENKEKALLERAKARVTFLQQLGLAAASAEPANVGDSWQDNDCVLKARQDGQVFSLVGTFERTNPFSGLAGALGGPIPSTKTKHTVTYSGVLRGRAIVGTVKRDREGSSLIDAASPISKCLMFLSEDGTVIFAMEKAGTDSPTYARLNRIRLLPAQNPPQT